jgi:bifunctional non-homologous end joining protein LigD
VPPRRDPAPRHVHATQAPAQCCRICRKVSRAATAASTPRSSARRRRAARARRPATKRMGNAKTDRRLLLKIRQAGQRRSARRCVSVQRAARRAAGAVPRISSSRVTRHCGEAAPSGERWVHEIKFDGYRTQAHLQQGPPAICQRGIYDWKLRFRTIADALASLPANELILDGEAVVADSRGVPDFGLLHADLAAGRKDRLLYFAFDPAWGRSARGAACRAQASSPSAPGRRLRPHPLCRAPRVRRRRDP